MDKTIASVLKPEQAKRFYQIERQKAGLGAFSREDVQKELKLTPAQQKEIKTVLDEFPKEWQRLQNELRSNSIKPDEFYTKFGELEKNLLQKAVALLNEAQRQTWKDLIGEPFDFRPEHLRRPSVPPKQ